MLSQRLADAARSLVGVAFSPGGRDETVGVDCAGLVIVSLQNCGIDRPADATYALDHGSDLGPLTESCLETMFERFEHVEIPSGLRPGDVLFMRYLDVRSHLGIYLGSSMMVHSVQGPRPGRAAAKRIDQAARGVVLSPIDHGLARKIRAVWRLKPAFDI